MGEATNYSSECRVEGAAIKPSPADGGREHDAGAQFILQSKGEWWHAGYHLTTVIVGPTILTLPYVFRGMGWAMGFLFLTVMGTITFYSYYLMSLVLSGEARTTLKGGRDSKNLNA